MWVVERQHKRDEDGQNVAVELRDDDGFMRANVRWDGCMQIWMESVTEENNTLRDTIHTCDLRGLIDRLSELKAASQELFDGMGYWSSDPAEPGDDLSYIPDDTSRGGATPPP
ncbi:hypothetical protein [Alicyclobacillus dauci]|uniref:Uncharacterized protein n=1 Tax=Alicyclobacillus dauci TaxID=1475485 RepID=A0ABY6Z696_9BACL|nr:hypothetical protein [Alicyclobacillus dauci]WAH37550.1 hypothetical protein NZD86_03185 [Alicyclobacillus dauci]